MPLRRAAASAAPCATASRPPPNSASIAATAATASASRPAPSPRSEEHTSELQSLMRISYAVFCLKKKKTKQQNIHTKSREHNKIENKATIGIPRLQRQQQYKTDQT